jgi:hypothetical protein
MQIFCVMAENGNRAKNTYYFTALMPRYQPHRAGDSSNFDGIPREQAEVPST